MRYPITVPAPDGRQITCHDAEHAAAAHILADWLIWPKVAAYVRDQDGDVDWIALERQAPVFASSERRLVQAAMDLYCGPSQDTAVGLKQLCHVLEAENLRRVLQAVMLLRPDVTLAAGWDG